MPVDGLAILTHGLNKNPDGSGPVHDIELDDDVFNLEDDG